MGNIPLSGRQRIRGSFHPEPGIIQHSLSLVRFIAEETVPQYAGSGVQSIIQFPPDDTTAVSVNDSCQIQESVLAGM